MNNPGGLLIAIIVTVAFGCVVYCLYYLSNRTRLAVTRKDSVSAADIEEITRQPTADQGRMGETFSAGPAPDDFSRSVTRERALPVEPNLDIRNCQGSAGCGLLVGLGMLVAVAVSFPEAIKAGQVGGPVSELVNGGFLLGGTLLGIGAMLFYTFRLLDRIPKLSLTQHGLQDHRTGLFVHWTDIQGARLWCEAVNGQETSAILYLNIQPRGKDSCEVAVEVDSLDVVSVGILQFVQQRVQEARNAAQERP